MRRNQTINKLALARTIGMISGIIIMVSGVTFAALQSQQDTLTGNTITTATTNLQLSTDGTSYSDSHSGFSFTNIVPGGSAVPNPGYSVYLKNSGGTPLALKLAVTSIPTNPNSVDLSKVSIILTQVSGAATPQTFTLQSLINGPVNLVTTTGTLANGVSQQFKIQVSMAADAVNGNSANLGNIDFSFNGIAVSN